MREGLAGEALSIRGEVDALQLGQYVRDRVPELARRRGHFQQQAVFKASGDLLPFPIAQPG